MMNVKQVVVGLLMMGLLAGCAGKPDLRFVWPPPPEEPKLEWIGVIYSEEGFKRTQTEQAFQSFIGSKDEITMQTPFGIASNGQGLVYVSDTHDKSVRIFDFNQGEIGQLSRMTAFDTPAGLDVDRQGNLYVADAGKALIMVFSAEHKPLFTFGEKVLQRPAYIEVDDRRGRVYVSDGVQHFVAVFDLQGKFLFKFGARGNVDGHFYSPQGLALSPDGESLVVADMFNARIQVFTPDGKFLSKFGKRGDQVYQFEQPKDVAFDSAGNLYVIDSRKSNMTVYNLAGEVLLVTGMGAATAHPMGFSAPKSVFIDTADRIFVAESLNRRFSIWQFMSESYRRSNPFTEIDRQRLIEHMEEVAAETEK